MKVIIIILAVLGLCKVISFLITCFIEIYYKIYRHYRPISKEYIQLERNSGIYKTEYFFIIPAISFNFIGGFEYGIKFLNFEYYVFYKLEFDDD